MRKTNRKIRICHPPHMPRYRMAHCDKIAKIINLVRHKLGYEVFRGTDLPPANSENWFKQRRAAKKTIAKATNGEFALMDNGFRGESHRHWLYHRKCRNNIFVPIDLVLQDANHACIYCGGSEDMESCGTVNLLQQFVFENSNYNAIAVLDDLQNANDERAYYCLLHREAYMISFKTFLETAGSTNGCPRCAAEAATCV